MNTKTKAELVREIRNKVRPEVRSNFSTKQLMRHSKSTLSFWADNISKLTGR